MEQLLTPRQQIVWQIRAHFLEALRSNNVEEALEILQTNDLDIDTVLEVEDKRMVLASYKQGYWLPDHKLECSWAMAIHVCVMYNSLETALVLLQKGAAVNRKPNGKTPLHVACTVANADFVALLLAYGARVNSLSLSGHTPLHYCVRKDSVDCAKQLILNGGNVNKPSQNKNENSPLHTAARLGIPELVALYISHGAQVDAVNSLKETPLITAAFWAMDVREQTYSEDHHLVCRILLDNGADPNLYEVDYKTALHKASWNCDHVLMQMLLEAGANPKTMDMNGCTPIQYVLKVIDVRPMAIPELCYQLLLNFGAPRIYPQQFHKVLQACHECPNAVEVMMNSYERIKPTDKWLRSIPESSYKKHKGFYESMFAVCSNSPRSLIHLARCAVRTALGDNCHNGIRCVRQRVPPSPSAVVIYLEPFLEKIRTSPGIPGYQLPGASGERLKVVAYMDDITIVGTDSRSITTATKAVEDYCAATGALVNRGKSELFLTPHWHESLASSFPVKTDKIKLLEITFQRDGGGSTSWAETICHVQRKICEWSARSLTMTGKTLILKAIVLPIVLYLGRVFPPDKTTSKKIERLMFTFVWGSQMERLKRSTLYKTSENGGKGVPDILNIIRAQQLSNLVSNINKPNRKASYFEKHYATPFLRTLGLSTIDHTVPYSWDPPKVYTSIRDFAFGSGLSTAGLASWKYKDIMGHIRSKDTVAPMRASSAVAPQQVIDPTSQATAENILNSPPGGCTTIQIRQQWRIICVIKQVLWETRNIRVFNKTAVDPITLRRRITILLRDHAITDFTKKLEMARAAWGVTRWKDINL
ncbi:hypothetical protein UPYG_G00332850 [Umbra pygmaea]|uniref:Reverse transcriptase domain-containing protein n=1 Tax=Umbra pygmaea TaxID=75934 RepID=A0ABD0WDX4_UMBPY